MADNRIFCEHCKESVSRRTYNRHQEVVARERRRIGLEEVYSDSEVCNNQQNDRLHRHYCLSASISHAGCAKATNYYWQLMYTRLA